MNSLAQPGITPPPVPALPHVIVRDGVATIALPADCPLDADERAEFTAPCARAMPGIIRAVRTREGLSNDEIAWLDHAPSTATEADITAAIEVTRRAERILAGV